MGTSFNWLHQKTLGLMASKKYVLCFMHVLCNSLIECRELCTEQ